MTSELLEHELCQFHLKPPLSLPESNSDPRRLCLDDHRAEKSHLIAELLQQREQEPNYVPSNVATRS